MEPILRGILEFQQRVYPEHRELFQELHSGQSPKTMLITCSDSRIDPALIMGTKPGDIFIVRNAGNIVAPADQPCGSEPASVEYALKVLGIEDLIVCGHTHLPAIFYARPGATPTHFRPLDDKLIAAPVHLAGNPHRLGAQHGDGLVDTRRREISHPTLLILGGGPANRTAPSPTGLKPSRSP